MGILCGTESPHSATEELTKSPHDNVKLEHSGLPQNYAASSHK